MKIHLWYAPLRCIGGVLILALIASPCFAQDEEASITLEGTIGGDILHATFNGDLAYLVGFANASVAEWTGTSFSQIGFLPLNEPIDVSAASGDRLYLASLHSVDVVDVTNPALPVYINGVSVTDDDRQIRGLHAVGDVAYVAESNGPGTDGLLWVLDASDPGGAVLRGQTAVAARDVYADGGVAYVLAATGALVAYDVSTPGNPAEMGRTAAFNFPPFRGSLFVAGDYAFVVGAVGGGMVVVDVANPANPRKVATWDDGTTYAQVFVLGTTAYLATDTGRFVIVDVTNAASPALLGAIETGLSNPSVLHVVDGALGKTAQGSLAYYLAQGQLLTIDVTDASAPRSEGPQEAPREMHDVATDGEAYFILGDDEVWEYALEGDAEVLQAHYPAGEAHLVDADGDYLYVADRNDDLRILEHSGAGAPVPRGTYHAPNTLFAMHVADGLACLVPDGAADPTVEFVDVSDADNPVRVSAFDLAAPGRAVLCPRSNAARRFADGDVAYVAYGTDVSSAGAVEIIDLTNPAAPVSLGSVDTFGLPRSITLENDILYAASDVDDGWAIEGWDVSDPSSPTQVASLVTPSGTTIGEVLATEGVLIAALHDQHEIVVYQLVEGEGKAQIPGSFGLNRVAGTSTLGFPSRTAALTVAGNVRLNVLSGSYTTSWPYYGSYEEKEHYKIKTPPPPPPPREPHSITLNVVPASSGCQASGPGQAYAGDVVTIVAQVTAACGQQGWNVQTPPDGPAWTGSVSGPSAVLTFTMPDNDVIASAHFIQPQLSLALTQESQLRCPPLVETTVPITTATLTADQLSAWQITEVWFYADGDEPDKQRPLGDWVDKAILRVHGVDVEADVIYTELVDGVRRLHSVHFTLDERIEKNESLAMTLFYTFHLPTNTIAFPNDAGPSFEAACSMDEVVRLQVRTLLAQTTSLIAAQPLDRANGLRLPGQWLYSGAFDAGCVHNLNARVASGPDKAGFASIQKAVDADVTQDGDALLVCSGHYQENVAVTKSLQIHSLEGPAKTIVQAASSQASVFDVRKENSILQGFFITGGSHGIWVNHTSHTTIGLPPDATGKTARVPAESQRNVVSGNHDGIFIEHGEGNHVRGNYVGTNLGGTAPFVLAVDDRPNGNSGNGIEIFGGSGNVIGGEEGVTPGGPCSGACNLVSGNFLGGVRVSVSRLNVIRGNYLGTDVTGMAAVPNSDGIRLLYRSSENQVGGTTIASRNVVSGNHGVGVQILGQDVWGWIQGNYIGTTASGDVALPNHTGVVVSGNTVIGRGIDQGVRIGGTTGTTPGGPCTGACNVISGNVTEGVLVSVSSETEVVGNYIGMNAAGQAALPNGDDGIRVENNTTIRIGTRAGAGSNLISGNEGNGIYIAGSFGLHEVAGNLIGSDITRKRVVGNGKNGIYTRAVDKASLAHNFVVGHDTPPFGVSYAGIRMQDSNSTNVSFNTLKSNDYGLYVASSHGVQVNHNLASNNDTAFEGVASTFTRVEGNNFQISTAAATGVHLTASAARLEGNSITDNAGAGILLDQGSSATLTNNNVWGNDDFGLKNDDPSSVIDAQGNWWGDASGPGGAGPGSGDAVSAGVDFSDFLGEPVSVVVTPSADTIYVAAGTADSAAVYLQSFAAYDDVLDVALSDELGWMTSPDAVSLQLADSLGGEATVYFNVPEEPAASWFHVEAVSRDDPTHAAADSFLVMTFAPQLVRITVAPDQVATAPDSALTFVAQGFDQHEGTFAFTPSWSASAGSIDEEGVFTPGGATGEVVVTATDGATGIQGQARVYVSDEEPALALIAVEPGAISLAPGERHLFTAEGLDQFDYPRLVDVLWQATGGVIDEDGFYTAGDVSGAYTVTAVDTASGMQGQAAVTIVGGVGVEEDGLPAGFSLYPNYPNPFNPETVIPFEVEGTVHVQLQVFDVLGRRVATLVDAVRPAGRYQVRFDASDLPSGVYFYRIEMGGFRAARKMVLMR